MTGSLYISQTMDDGKDRDVHKRHADIPGASSRTQVLSGRVRTDLYIHVGTNSRFTASLHTYIDSHSHD